jgi:pectate lyase
MSRLLVIIAIFASFGYIVYGADGFGQATTGGAEGKVVTIAGDAAAFRMYVETADVPYIVQVAGTIDLSAAGGSVSIRSNKTIQGVGEKPTIIGELGFKNGSSNVIIEGLNITNPKGGGEGDGLSIKENITNVFVTHCTFYDCIDGCLDITRESDLITVSWCKFYFTEAKPQANRVSLIGNSDASTEDEGKLRITLHHNWYGPNCWQRIPSVRYGKVHLYNNYYDCEGNLYGIWSRIKAECLIENNMFKGIKDPYRIHIENEAAEDKGKICARGNGFENCRSHPDEGKDAVFAPPYAYVPDETEKIADMVKAGAGASSR